MTSTEPTTSRTMFDTVLVANRGEIACRVIQTLAAMGIRSVAVYSDADRGAKHVLQADAAVRIGPAAPLASYLNVQAIIAAALASGAQAVHPGYGFLSESVAFAQACADAGLVFIGPGVHALDVMGDKIRAKNHVSSHSVPVIPGIAEPGLTDEQLFAAADDIGYPILIKPSAGGGGKGMQEVIGPDRLQDALSTARRVAASAFGDDTLFLERLVHNPRHIEVQVLADNHGNVIHLGERECSLQRRHQKVIEEAPSPLLDAATRARIGEAACQAARSVDYSGAGTVEFLVSADAPDDFFFMEMNTRLQVEHPVTEMVTGMDLVEWQVRIAAGEVLTVAQDEVRTKGHAIEARVYAENPERGFLPSTGTILALSEASATGIRVDSSLTEGLEVSGNYDPMLAKVIAWARTREEALARLDAALADTVVLGVSTNIEFLRGLLADPDVRAGNLDTSLIERVLPGLSFHGPDGRLLAAAALVLHAERAEAAQGIWQQPDGWRIGGQAVPSRYSLAVSATETVDVLVAGTAERSTISIDGAEPMSAGLIRSGQGRYSVEIDGRIDRLRMARQGARLWVGAAGHSVELVLRSRADRLADQLAGIIRENGPAAPDIRSPMPGTVIAVNVVAGEQVEQGQTLLIVEAMKMEHQLTATVSGTVSINVVPGDVVGLDQIVATIAPREEPVEVAATA
ncbi:acetyl/propionyl/methylcrotonyl-CoA carboxylase subunit alpha [Parafrigoribacterium mesophilum]|uniref:acetyl/propionyl/methylcrotonyl-CoA carboxylase subunit alpha n=1 Tax=Parafrigoribacterium mesophilum TaxID=433646 RepID=UPI0031FD8AE6